MCDEDANVPNKTDFISREAAISEILSEPTDAHYPSWYDEKLKQIPVADVVAEENILKFYYVRSTDEYWIGQRHDTLYYARYDSERQQWVWTHSRYLPWGEHVVSPTSLWKEHTYPSEPEEIHFTDWLQGFAKKHMLEKHKEV